jgi:hypothetical protein
MPLETNPSASAAWYPGNGPFLPVVQTHIHIRLPHSDMLSLDAHLQLRAESPDWEGQRRNPLATKYQSVHLTVSLGTSTLEYGHL